MTMKNNQNLENQKIDSIEREGKWTNKASKTQFLTSYRVTSVLLPTVVSQTCLSVSEDA